MIRKTIFTAVLILFIFTACESDSSNPFGIIRKIEEINPNPASIGDTITVSLSYVSTHMSIGQLEEISIEILDAIPIPQKITGYSNVNRDYQLGNFVDSEIIKSMEGHYFIQFVSVNNFQIKGRIKIKVNGHTITSVNELIIH